MSTKKSKLIILFTFKFELNIFKMNLNKYTFIINIKNKFNLT